MNPPANAVDTPKLHDYLAVLKARKWTIVLVVLAAVAFSFYRTRSYDAEAKVLVRPLPDPSGVLAVVNIETEAEIVASTSIATLVRQDLGLDRSPASLLEGLEVQPVRENTSVLSITYSSPDPALARDVANSFAHIYLKHRRAQARKAVSAATKPLRAGIREARRELQNLSEDLTTARSQNPALLPALQAQWDITVTRLGILQQRLDGVQPQQPISKGGGQMIEPASRPSTLVSRRYREGLIAGLLGLALAVGLALLKERLDDRVRTQVDIESVLQTPVLGIVPKFATRRKTPEVVSTADPRAPASEMYRSLAATFQFVASQRELRSVVITSPGQGEGKTISSINLAVALAQMGRKTALVSADLRRPSLERYLQVQENREGLAAWLAGEQQSLSSIMHPTPIAALSVVRSGRIPANPGELLNSPRVAELVSDLEERFDVTIFDSPPALPVADALALAGHVGRAILVVRASTTQRLAALQAKNALEGVGSIVLGCVLNAFDPARSPYRYAYYYRTQRRMAEAGTSFRRDLRRPNLWRDPP